MHKKIDSEYNSKWRFGLTLHANEGSVTIVKSHIILIILNVGVSKSK